MSDSRTEAAAALAYGRGVLDVLAIAEAAARAIEAQPEFKPTRHGFAVAALAELAVAGRELLIRAAPAETEKCRRPRHFPRSEEPSADPIRAALVVIANEPGDAGSIECPACRARLEWSRSPVNGHVWGRCETADCIAWMQ